MKPKICEVGSRARKKSQSGSTSKSKSKGKSAFNTIKFLHAQINIPEPKNKNIPKNNTKLRTIQTNTPIPSVNKNRKSNSKSSYSQYRRRDTPLMNDIFNLNINNILTEQDCIRYTQMVSNESKPIKNDKIQEKKTLQSNEAAKIIQRQWRKFKTLTMVKKYYNYYSKIQKDKEKLEQLELDKTLKIKSSRKAPNICNFTRKNSKQQIKQIMQDGIQTPSPRVIQYKQSNPFVEMKEIQAKRCNEVMQLIEKQTNQNHYDTVLNELLKKLEENKNVLERDIESQPTHLLQTPQIKKIQNNNNSSPFEYQTNLKVSNQQQISKYHVGGQSAQCKLLSKRINRIEQGSIFEIAKIEALREIKSISQRQANSKIKNLHQKTKRQIAYLKNLIKSYQNIVDEITNIAIQEHKLKNLSKGNSKLRKCFSSESIVLKKIIEQQKISLIQIISPSKVEQIQQFKEYSSCQSKYFVDDQQADLLIQIQSKQIQNANGQLSESFMKVCSEKFQKQVEQRLINEITFEIYMSQGLYQMFKHKVESQIQFFPITDLQIKEFLEKISQFFPDMEIILKLFNQKINPSASQILRIIRDQDCELQQYEIILSESIFNKYRAWAEKYYQAKKIQTLGKIKCVQSWITEKKISDKIQQRIANKKNNYGKFLQFQRDLKAIYLKCVFNCLNEYLIQYKSFCTYMNARSSIGPGELTMALKEYNRQSTFQQMEKIMQNCKQKIVEDLRYKCVIPNFGNPHNIKLFYKMSQKQLELQLNQNQYKWVNFMDQSLEVWIDITISITNMLINEAAIEIITLNRQV